MIKKYLMYLIIAVAIGILIGSGGCDTTNQTYRNFTVKNKMTSFSFEYPAHYRRNGPSYWIDEIKPDRELSPSTSISFQSRSKPMPITVPDPSAGRLGTFSTEYAPIDIEVFVFDAKPYYNTPQNGKGRLEYLLSELARSWANFQLLDRSQVIVSGISAEFAYYSVDAYFPFPREGDLKLEYVRAAYFDYGGYIWKIKAMAHGGEAIDQMKIDFDHLVETFKIIK